MKNKTLKFDNFKVKVKTIDSNSNYNLSVQVLRNNNTLILGTIMNENSKDLDILEFAVSSFDAESVDLFQ